ncbi:hypothetical protein HpBT072_03980 [Helicobacter pylori]
MSIFSKMYETKDDMDIFYCSLEEGIDLACRECYFFRIFADDIEFEFNRDYFTHNYGEAPLYYEIGGVSVACDENIDVSLNALIKEKKLDHHYDCYIELFKLELEGFIEKVSSSNRGDVEDCLFFLAKWIYVNGIYKNEEGELWHAYEWDILDMQDQIDDIAIEC